MNVEIRTESAHFPEKEYINRISVAVRGGDRHRQPTVGQDKLKNPPVGGV